MKKEVFPSKCIFLSAFPSPPFKTRNKNKKKRIKGDSTRLERTIGVFFFYKWNGDFERSSYRDVCIGKMAMPHSNNVRSRGSFSLPVCFSPRRVNVRRRFDIRFNPPLPPRFQGLSSSSIYTYIYIIFRNIYAWKKNGWSIIIIIIIISNKLSKERSEDTLTIIPRFSLLRETRGSI